MKIIYKFFKNSNTNELVQSQEFLGSLIKDIPTYYYGSDGRKIGENLTLKGFVEISEKKFKRYKKKLK